MCGCKPTIKSADTQAQQIDYLFTGTPAGVPKFLVQDGTGGTNQDIKPWYSFLLPQADKPTVEPLPMPTGLSESKTDNTILYILIGILIIVVVTAGYYAFKK